jgi:D-xylose transport system substrate-binding protein
MRAPRILTFAAIGVLVMASVSSCGDSDPPPVSGGSSMTVGKGDGRARVGVILPDTKSSTRWTEGDPKYLAAAFAAAGIPAEIENAQGNPADFVKIAQNMAGSGVKVLMIVNLDPVSGKAALQAAQAKGIPTVDYDRLTLNGGADYYVTFGGEQVGRLQAFGLGKCLEARKAKDPVIAELNGSSTDDNAIQYKAGYDEVLGDNYDRAQMIKGPDQFVPDWDPALGATVFEQMLNQYPDIAGVVAANDGLAGAVIKVLKKHHLNGRVPVTGQDATLAGLQAILAGDQCMTIYKDTRSEAQAAVAVATQLFRGRRPAVPGNNRIKDRESGAYVPLISLESVPIDRSNIKSLVETGFVAAGDLCAGRYATACDKLGITSR